MRRTRLGAILLILLGLLSGCDFPGGPTPTPAPTPVPRSTQVAATLATYQDPALVFTIGYPNDWQVNEGERQVDFSDPYGMLHIMVQYADAGQALDETSLRGLVDSYFGTDRMGATPGFKREKDTLQSDGSILVEYSFTNSGVPGYGKTLFVQHGTMLYILSFWVMQQDLWAANQSFFETVLSSFHPLR